MSRATASPSPFCTCVFWICTPMFGPCWPWPNPLAPWPWSGGANGGAVCRALLGAVGCAPAKPSAMLPSGDLDGSPSAVSLGRNVSSRPSAAMQLAEFDCSQLSGCGLKLVKRSREQPAQLIELLVFVPPLDCAAARAAT